MIVSMQGSAASRPASMLATIRITSACSSEWLRLSSCWDLPAAAPLHALNSRHAAIQIAALAMLGDLLWEANVPAGSEMRGLSTASDAQKRRRGMLTSNTWSSAHPQT